MSDVNHLFDEQTQLFVSSKKHFSIAMYENLSLPRMAVACDEQRKNLIRSTKGTRILRPIIMQILLKYFDKHANDSQHNEIFNPTYVWDIAERLSDCFTVFVLYQMQETFPEVEHQFRFEGINENWDLFSDKFSLSSLRDNVFNVNYDRNHSATAYMRKQNEPFREVETEIYNLLTTLMQSILLDFSRHYTIYNTKEEIHAFWERERERKRAERSLGGSFSEEDEKNTKMRSMSVLFVFQPNQYYFKTKQLTLHNEVGVCYLNSVVYILYYIEPLRNYIFDAFETLELQGNILEEFNDLFEHIYDRKTYRCDAVPILTQTIEQCNLDVSGEGGNPFTTFKCIVNAFKTTVASIPSAGNLPIIGNILFETLTFKKNEKMFPTTFSTADSIFVKLDTEPTHYALDFGRRHAIETQLKGTVNEYVLYAIEIRSFEKTAEIESLLRALKKEYKKEHPDERAIDLYLGKAFVRTTDWHSYVAIWGKWHPYLLSYSWRIFNNNETRELSKHEAKDLLENRQKYKYAENLLYIRKSEFDKMSWKNLWN